MSQFFIRNMARLLLIFHFSIIYSIIFIISFFFKKKIRFINNVYSEIGQITWIDGLLRKQIFFKKKEIIICLNYGTHIANQFIEDLKYLKFKEFNILSISNKYLTNLLKPICLIKNQFISNNYHTPFTSEYQKLPKIDWVSDKDKEYKKEIKDFFGLKENDWYVCFFARDSYYDEKYRPKLVEDFEIRNMNINNFELAINFIVNQGGHVIRIGSNQKNKLNCADSNRIHDYAFNANKYEKMDVLINFYSKFMIGTGSGIIDIGLINNIPLGLVNNHEYLYSQGIKRGTFIPKIYYKEDNSILTNDEYLDMVGSSKNMSLHLKKIKKLKLTVRDNSPDDILELTKDFYNKYIQNKKVDGLDDEASFSKNGLKINSKFFKKNNL